MTGERNRGLVLAFPGDHLETEGRHSKLPSRSMGEVVHVLKDWRSNGDLEVGHPTQYQGTSRDLLKGRKCSYARSVILCFVNRRA